MPFSFHSVCVGGDGLCNGKASETELLPCAVDACVCVILKEDYVEAFGTDPPTDTPIGWVETDGEEGKSPEEKPVHIGDVIEPGDTVEIVTDTECGRW